MKEKAEKTATKSISIGHKFFDNASSGYYATMVAIEDRARLQFQANHSTVKKAPDPILHIDAESSEYAVKSINNTTFGHSHNSTSKDEVSAEERYIQTQKQIEVEQGILETLKSRRAALQRDLRKHGSVMHPSPVVRETAFMVSTLQQSAKTMLNQTTSPDSPSLRTAESLVKQRAGDKYNYPRGPERHPRHTLMLASLGFTSATTAEAMADVIRKKEMQM